MAGLLALTSNDIVTDVMELLAIRAGRDASLHFATKSVKSPMSKARRPGMGHVKEDDDMRNLVSPGVKLIPTLVTKEEEHLQKTLGKYLTNFPVNTATVGIFTHDCMWASLQMSISVDSCIRDCQHNSLANTQDIQNILVGSHLEVSKAKNQSFCTIKDIGQEQDRKMMNGKVICYLKSRVEACSQPKCTSSQTLFYAQVPARWIQSALLKYVGSSHKQV